MDSKILKKHIVKSSDFTKVLIREVRAHKPLPKNKGDLWRILQEEWLNINADKCQNLVDSMPRRVAAVINSKGNPIKY
jgi:hypothetical protein